MLKGKKIILGITGSIAAYKAATLIRLLIRKGAVVQVVMTDAAKDFITPLTLSTLSQRPVLSEPFQGGSGQWNSHIDWAAWADAIVIAPLTANTLAKMANGQADNLLTAIYLAARSPVFFAPVMDVDMFEHPATTKNIHTLQSYGNILIPPDEGELASGLSGKGRMKEPDEIVSLLESFFKKKNRFRGKKVLITAGPTYEKIDPVRFIGNYSSGKMGFALANAFAGQGAEVILVTGPVSLRTACTNIQRVDVSSAREMFDRCMKHFPTSDICIMTAAVADYRPAMPAKQKIKKSDTALSLELTPNPDILKTMGEKKKNRQFLTGFALETRNAKAEAMKKLRNKKLDLIVVNSLKDAGAGFGHDTNKVTLIDKEENIKVLPLMSKEALAGLLTEKIYEYLINKENHAI
ncbi:MAG TPA: bifunctional phosphopantothenoylcysteine decarboxylase/phosphopantothenate--cysteine ligase CoaBC [Bacteroidales bacterium]|nr:bifunctional phosphopantothenoylcysteine decarboxylase/phosphopantothenate--cysteine ligase CoaBC [Bacteroidales bacterium]HSA42686.1 bifunctional phosphopantothenoylcysteine decarboxylase/phosphopantothenate--cysteine ligase CoaBC [Bacteroidales bacterium]